MSDGSHTGGNLKRTPLYPLYGRYGARTVEFAGWEMPVQFRGILEEHAAVRSRAGLFDVSHMGELEVSGPAALAFLQRMVTNDVGKLKPGAAMYTLLTYPDGGCVDDLLVYCLKPDRYLLVVNAANTDRDRDWLRSNQAGEQLQIRDCSAEWALLALQGPLARAVLARLTDADVSALRRFRFVSGQVAGVPCLISRTGYTGEDGFELYIPFGADADRPIRVWEALLAEGAAEGVLPCGLGSRDTLRMEAALPLYGHELTPEITPVEAGLTAFIRWDKGPFVGREPLWEQAQSGPARMLCGLRLLERGIPRAGYPVWSAQGPAGHVTSGTMSPTLKVPIAMALVQREAAGPGSVLEVDVRGKRIPAEVVPLPFYRR
ncbi:MAG: glycine cleavage system aminomethyltransferase GcvT [Alicyclobacillus sp.]|nr:glycine cleavage system aminomethyltransferase GcvT [Alicyclobacillus sp.]